MVSSRRAGEDHRTKQQNKLMAFHLRRGSTPPLVGGHNRYGLVPGQLKTLHVILLSLSLNSFSSLLYLPQIPPFLRPPFLRPLFVHPPSFLLSSISSSPCLLSFNFTFSLSHSSQNSFDQSDGQKLSERFSSSLALTNNKSSASMERGRFLSPGLGIRASRSYDLLTDAIHEDHTDIGDVFSLRDNTPFMSYGISPRL